jgi:hypothetical protein
MAHLRRGALVMAAVVSVMLAACGGSERVKQRAWHRPISLSGVHGTANGQAIAMNPKGDAIAVWQYSRSRAVGAKATIQAATRPAGGTFSKPVSLSAPGKDAINPRPAIDPAGNAIVVWQRGHPIQHNDDRVQASVRPAGGTFSKPVTLSAPGKTSEDAEVAMDRDGNAIAVWERGDPYQEAYRKNAVVQAATLRAGGSFSAPVTLSSPARAEPEPVLAMSPAGHAVVAWEQHTPAGWIIQAAVREPGGRFSTPADLSVRNHHSQYPEVAIDRAGGATVVWERGTITSPKHFIQAATRPAAGAFSKPVDLTEPSGISSLPRVAMDPAGDTIAVWARYDPSDDSDDSWAQASVRPAGGDFSKPMTLSATAAHAHQTTIAMNQSGDAVAVWASTLDGRGAQASFGDAGGHFSTPVTLAPTLLGDDTQGVDNPYVAIDRASQAITVWLRELDTEGHFVVQQATSQPKYDPSP